MRDFAWYEIDPSRLELERELLTDPWRLVRDDDGRYAWEGGTLKRKKPYAEHSLRLIYPHGYPARFIEARLRPSLTKSLSGSLGVHVNLDGSVCYVTAEGWTPQDTVATALGLLQDWWETYYWLVGLKTEQAQRIHPQIPEK